MDRRRPIPSIRKNLIREKCGPGVCTAQECRCADRRIPRVTYFRSCGERPGVGGRGGRLRGSHGGTARDRYTPPPYRPPPHHPLLEAGTPAQKSFLFNGETLQSDTESSERTTRSAELRERGARPLEPELKMKPPLLMGSRWVPPRGAAGHGAVTPPDSSDRSARCGENAVEGMGERGDVTGRRSPRSPYPGSSPSRWDIRSSRNARSWGSWPPRSPRRHRRVRLWAAARAPRP